MKATKTQIGGTHYHKSSYQPIEFISHRNLNFFQGNIVKYITRHRCKNGKEDLLKCVHYCELALELSPASFVDSDMKNNFADLLVYSEQNKLCEIEHNIIASSILNDWKKTKELLNTLIAIDYAD